MSEDTAKEVAKLLTDASQMEDVEAYVARGRFHAHMHQNDLADRWISAYQKWSHNPTSRTEMTEFTDIHCEFILRNTEPPHAKVADAEARVIAKITADYEKTINNPALADQFHKSLEAASQRLLIKNRKKTN